MKQIICITCLVLLISCNTKKEIEETENNAVTDTVTKENNQRNSSPKVPETIVFDSVTHNILKNEFKNYSLYRLKDTIKADFNGDNVIDFAFFTTLRTQRSLFIIDGKTKIKNKIGQDKSFSTMANDFSWVDFWGTTEDKETFEILIGDSEIKGDTITPLLHKSIFVRKEEVGGGVITYKDNRFIWIHQSD